MKFLKGQYLPAQAILVSAIGVFILLGTVTLFTQIEDLAVTESERQEVKYIESQLSNSVYGLKEVESGRVTLNLPNEIGGSSYQIETTGNESIIQWDGNTYDIRFSDVSRDYEFEGSTVGGRVEVVKTENTYTIMEG